MKRLFFFLTIVLFFPTVHSKGQSFPQWGSLVKGPYAVGYKDTVVFKPDEKFSYYSYNSNKPVFISIWYPAQDKSSQSFMRFKNYLDFSKHENYQVLLDSLKAIFHHILIKDGVAINIKLGKDEVKFDSIHNELYKDILNTIVFAKRNLSPIQKKFPCVFYQHGAQSTPYDNNVFCEYMTSHGFVVVSANYNLPNEKQANMLITSTDDQFNRLTDLSFVLQTTKSLAYVDSSQVIAAGHSLGAQTAILFDSVSLTKSFKKIIAFHTTLEDKNLTIAKKFWPNFSYLYENQCGNSTTPTILFAPTILTWKTKKDSLTGNEIISKVDTTFPSFIPFRNNKTTPYTFITIKHPVTHDGFIALGNLRFPYINKYSMTDKEQIIKQQYYYEQIVLLTRQIAVVSLDKTTSLDGGFLNENFRVESTKEH